MRTLVAPPIERSINYRHLSILKQSSTAQVVTMIIIVAVMKLHTVLQVIKCHESISARSTLSRGANFCVSACRITDRQAGAP